MANSPAPAPASAPVQRNQPAHEVRLGTVKAATWQNDTDAGVRYNVTFERLYNQEGEWRSTGSFGRDDLLLLAKVADLAHSWILAPAPAEAAAPARTGGHAAPRTERPFLAQTPECGQGRRVIRTDPQRPKPAPRSGAFVWKVTGVPR